VRLACELRIGRDLCLTPVDVPLVPASVFRALAREWVQRGRPESGWLGPFVRREGTRLFGHPIVVGRELARRLKDFPPDQPLSQLRAEARPLLALEVVEPEILDDLDTPGDLARLEARER
jgi:CTP:molybdopterin cytidylyltransferase MocA